MTESGILEMLPRMILSTGIVLVVMIAAARLLKNRKIPGTGGIRFGAISPAEKTIDIEVLARQGVSRHASVAVIRTGDQSLVIGITEQSVSLLHCLSNSSETQSTEAEDQSSDVQWTDIGRELASQVSLPSSTGTGILSLVRERTVRH